MPRRQLLSRVSLLSARLLRLPATTTPSSSFLATPRRCGVKNRCAVTGRSRGYMREFGLSRITFRELARQGKIPGVKKASW